MDPISFTFTTVHLFGLIAAAGVIAVLAFLFHQDRCSANEFRLIDLFKDKQGASLSKVASMTALIVSTWAFVFLTLDSKLTETYYLTYMATWSGSRLLSKYLDNKSTKEVVQG